MPNIKPEEIEDPKVFCHLAGHPPLEGETMRQYLERVTPLLGKDQLNPTKEKKPWPVWATMIFWFLMGYVAAQLLMAIIKAFS